MSFLGETNATAAHAEGSLNTFNNNNNNNHQQQFDQTSNRQLDAQNQDKEPFPTTTQPPVSIRSPLQAVIAMVIPTSLQQLSIWTPFALLRHRSRPIDNNTSIKTAPDNAATQNPSKHMHSWTNPMAGMDLIAAERPKSSILKVRRLQDSIDSKYHGGSDCKKTRENFTALSEIPAVQRDNKTSLSLEDCSERQRQRTPDIFVALKEKPRYQGPKKSIWQAWQRDDPHVNPHKHGCILLRDKGGIARILKKKAVVKVDTQRKPMSFVDQVGVKFIPRRLDKCNSNAYIKDMKESVKRNYSEVDEEVGRRRQWKRICTRFAMAGFNRHYSAITSQWQLRAAARQEASTTDSSDFDDDSMITNDLSSRIDRDDTFRVSCSNFSTNETTNEDDDSTTTNDLSSRIDSDDTVRVSGSDFPTNQSTNEDDDCMTTNDLSSRLDCDDTVRVSGSDSPTNETTNEDDDCMTTNDLSSSIDSDDTVRVSGSHFSTNETTNEDDDSTTTNDLSSRIDSDDTVRVSGSDSLTNETTSEDDDCMTTNDLSSRLDCDDTVRVSGSHFSTNETTNEDDDSTTTNDLSSRIDSDDTVRVSGSDSLTNETTSEDDDCMTTNDLSSRLDCDDTVRVSGSHFSTNETTNEDDDSTTTNAATQNPSKHMHSWTNPMAGMDSIAAERSKSSILKVRRLQDSIDSKYPGGSDCKKTRENFTALSEIPAVQRDNKTSLPLEDCSERQRQRTPDIFVALKEKPRYQGPKKSIWQAWERDEPHIDINKHGCILLRDVGGIARILKWDAAMEDEIPYRKPLSFVGQTGVKFIPRRLDKCNANAYLKDLKESVKTNYSEVDEEVGRRRQWKRICTRFALAGFNRHYSAITSQWQLRAAARQEASTTESSDIDDDSTTTNDLSSRIDRDDTVRVSCSNFSTNETTNEDDDSTTTNDLSSRIDSDDTVRVSGSNFSANETTNEDDDCMTTNDLSSRLDCDDTVRVSGSNLSANETTNEDDDCMTTNDLSSPIDSDDTVRVSGSNLSTNDTTNGESTTTRRHRRTTIKSTAMEVDGATVWVNGRRRSSRLQPKTGSIWMNGRRRSARFLS
ncbi:hypothetical protein IV203_036976 [Nitzschia inconspicua]|uniref:Uncharacterized protein n=1 Tax=Nitzschia inconspicua TaxID=303405 RepID=A0A9K3LHB2_9STRA|nr:hypothetical protein IV203_036976 [Nitzschia inconspicua]